MAERYPEAELVLDDELLYDEAPRRSMLRRSDERPEDIVREGEVLAGKYRVERIPGRNGLGVLVQVRHMELGQEVTLKFLVPEACAYPEFVQRFVREARSAVRIQGEHVARVTDVGRLESGAPYMVREYLRGPDLAEVLKVRGPLPVSEAVDYVIQACEGVAEGHALGVVHRNLRPTSMIVTRRSDGMPLVKVFDFAASETLHVNPFTERAVSLVGTSAIMASLPYLAPEQIRDPHDVDFRADVYSLGAVLFELLTGQPVYAADAAPALLAQVAADAAPSVRSLRADVPGELDHIVLRSLAKNRAIRYASLADLVTALKQFASPETESSVDRIVRLGKRTSKLPEATELRQPSSLPPAPSVPVIAPPPARARVNTMPLAEHAATPLAQPVRPSVHDDVTTINPYSSYAAPVVIHPEVAREARREAMRQEAASRVEPQRIEPQRIEPQRIEPMRAEPPRSEREPVRTEPLPPVRPPSVPSVRAEPVRIEPPQRRTPMPPPMRASGNPPPLREASVVTPLPVPQSQPPAMPTQPAATPAAVASPSDVPAPRVTTTALPPAPSAAPAPRSSISGLSRSWAVPEEPAAPKLFTPRNIGVAALAACVVLGGVLALRSNPAPAPVAAAQPPAPPKVEAPKPPPAPEPAPVDSAAAAASASAAAVASAAPSAAPAPVAAAPAPAPAPVAAAPAPAPVAAAPKPIVAAAPAPKPVAAPVVVRRPATEAPAEAPRKPAAEKVASSKPAGGGDLFDDPR